jgi:hypothetical protein
MLSDKYLASFRAMLASGYLPKPTPKGAYDARRGVARDRDPDELAEAIDQVCQHLASKGMSTDDIDEVRKKIEATHGLGQDDDPQPQAGVSSQNLSSGASTWAKNASARAAQDRRPRYGMDGRPLPPNPTQRQRASFAAFYGPDATRLEI